MPLLSKLLCSCGAEQTTQLDVSREMWATNLVQFLRIHRRDGHTLSILRPSLLHPETYLPPRPLDATRKEVRHA